MNLKEIKELINLVNDKGFTDFEIEREGFRMRVSRKPASDTPSPIVVAPPLAVPSVAPILPAAPTVASVAAPASPSAEPATASPEPELHIIKSPLVGTFYRSPSPTSEPFVRIGDQVEPETVVCIVEAMKLMNNIQAEASGEVAKVFAENGQPVEYGQPLFGIKQ